MPSMKRAAIYARFSDAELQRDKSIDDQIALCRDYAARNGYEVVAVYDDRGVSGASLHGRSGIKRLLEDAKAGAFAAVIAETTSRIGRDQEDRAAIRKRLQFASVDLITPGDGVVTNLTDGIRAVLDSQYLDDLKLMIRRGMRGVVREGRNAGGRAYGYRPVPGQPGALVIVADEESVIRRVFEDYVRGVPAREIAHALNREGVPPPRGRFWRANTISGNAERGHGILKNEVYAGRLVWNRVRMVKDPDTGKRVSRPNPPDQWARAEVPHLRIVSDEMFEKAQARSAVRALPQVRRTRRPKHLLSGLLRCGACGGGIQVKDKDHGRIRIVCSTFKESGACDNRRSYYLDAIERAVTSGLRTRLMQHDAIALYLKQYNAERRRLAASAIHDFDKLTAELARLQGRLDRAVRGYADGDLPAAEAKKLVAEAVEARDRAKAALERAEIPPKIVSLHPKTVARYLASIGELERTLAEHRAAGEHPASKALRDLVASVTVRPAAAGQPVEIEVLGRLTALVGGHLYPTMKLKGNISGGVMVAEEGLEPPTRGL